MDAGNGQDVKTNKDMENLDGEKNVLKQVDRHGKYLKEIFLMEYMYAIAVIILPAQILLIFISELLSRTLEMRDEMVL